MPGRAGQGVALVLNAYAKLELIEPDLFRYLGVIAVELPASNFNSQAVSNVANAFARAELRDAALFDRLSEIARGLGPDEFSSQVRGESQLLGGCVCPDIVVRKGKVSCGAGGQHDSQCVREAGVRGQGALSAPRSCCQAAAKLGVPASGVGKHPQRVCQGAAPLAYRAQYHHGKDPALPVVLSRPSESGTWWC